MRQVKFRYWNGSKVLNQEAIINHLNKYIARNDKHLMQFTGLFDKQGVEIYEGDILSHHLQGNRFVEYGSPFKNYGGYMLVSKDGMRGTLNDPDKLYEVIGNIYENKELLV